MRQVVGIVLYQGANLILVREGDQDVWKLPGGGQEPGENDQQTIERELAEELPSVMMLGHPRFMGTLVGPSPWSGDICMVAVYTAPFAAEGITPGAEISVTMLASIEEALQLTASTPLSYRAVRLFETFRRLIL